MATLPGIASVIEKDPGDISESGTKESSNGQLAVRFFPDLSVAGDRLQRYPFATAAQIIKGWRDATRDFKHLVINPGPESVIPTASYGEIAVPEQVVIYFSSPTLDDKVLQLVTHHPQTIGLRWGGPFMSLYCPLCGIG